MEYIHRYEAYGHGNADTTPAGDEHANIVGLELEIAELLDAEVLEQLIDDGLVETYDSGSAYIQLEEEAQHNVQYELIFNADTPANVLKRLHAVSDLRHAVSNHHETSCHVHVNRYWLENSCGISELEYFRAAEAIAPLIYSISGRDSYSWDEWTPSKLDADVSDVNGILSRFEDVDNVRPNDSGAYSDRYELCNCQNDATIEIRGFSNYYEFDCELIAFYIAVADTLIPRIAAAMKGKKYSSDYRTALKVVADFLNDFEPYANRFNLRVWRNVEAALLQYKRHLYNAAIAEFENVQNIITAARNEHRAADAAYYVVKALRLYRWLELPSINLENVSETINELEDLNQRHFKNRVWRI